MRTTISVGDELLRRAKKAALERDATVNDIFEAALREYLNRLQAPESIQPVKLPVSKQRGGVQPGIDLDDTASLLDAIEDRRR